MSAPPELGEQALLHVYLRRILLLATAFGVSEVTAAAFLVSPRLAMAGFATWSVAASAWVADRWARQQRIIPAAALVAYHLLALCLVATAVLPFTYPVLLITTILAVASVLPYVKGRPLNILLLAGCAVAAAVAVYGHAQVGSVARPGWVDALVLMGGAIGGCYLVFLLLGQFSHRLWSTVERQREAEARMRFLAEASAAFGESLDYRETLTGVARAVVPALADWCAVFLIDGEGRLERVVALHRDAARGSALATLNPFLPEHPESRALFEVLRSHRPLRTNGLTAPEVRAFAPRSDQARSLRELGAGAAQFLPLVVRGQSTGLVCLFRADPARSFSPEEELLAYELVRRAALAIDNARLYRAAQQLAQLREDFLVVASHELRTPMASLSLDIGSILREVQSGRLPGLPDRLVSKIVRASKQVHRITYLIGQLLDVSRINRGELVLEREDVDLAALTAEVIERLQPSLEGADCSVEARLDPRVVGHWDRNRLDQVITNLLSNAMKYGAGRPIDVVVQRIKTRASLNVRDRGMGIEAKDHARIFQAFERAVSVRQYGGLGLGLWITKGIVEAHGGSISVASVPGEGATFTVELPLSEVF